MTPTARRESGASRHPRQSVQPFRSTQPDRSARAAAARRTDRDLLAIKAATSLLDVGLVDIEPVSLGRTGIYRAVITCDRRWESLPTGTSVQAIHVTRDHDCLTPPEEMHRLVYRLHALGAPVAQPRHRDVVVTRYGEVGFWAWMDATPLTAHEWGSLTGRLHRTGMLLQHAYPGTYEPGRVFVARIRRIRELAKTPGHPLFGADALVRSFEDALEVALGDALRAAAAAPMMLVHGDNQPANVMCGRDGLVLNDFERIAFGPAALDLAALQLGIQHYGYPSSSGADFLDSYGSDAPSLEDARPYARIRELSGAVVAMLQAGDSPEMEHEMRIRRTAITNPGDGEPWTYVQSSPTSRLVVADQADRQKIRKT